MAPRVLIAGVATRGLAESAARAGYEVVAVDGFGDLDLHARAHAVLMARDARGRFSTQLVVQAARRIPCDAVAYVAPLENHPGAVRALARGSDLWGNPPAVLNPARDPVRLAAALLARGILPPNLYTDLHRTPPPPPGRQRWIVKPLASGGGHGITRWRGGMRPPRGTYLQERIIGTPGSVVFAADGARAAPLGLTRMLVGDRAFGASDFRYCGSILVSRADAFDDGLEGFAADIASRVTDAFRLRGVNGVDFVERGDLLYPIELNPRYTASMELVERAYGLAIFEIHARACRGELPAFDLAAARASGPAVGKAIVYAQRDVIMGDTRPWLDDEHLRDIPQPGERIPRGRPVCTVFARGRDAKACHAALVKRAQGIYHAIAASKAKTA